MTQEAISDIDVKALLRNERLRFARELFQIDELSQLVVEGRINRIKRELLKRYRYRLPITPKEVRMLAEHVAKCGVVFPKGLDPLLYGFLRHYLDAESETIMKLYVRAPSALNEKGLYRFIENEYGRVCDLFCMRVSNRATNAIIKKAVESAQLIRSHQVECLLEIQLEPAQ